MVYDIVFPINGNNMKQSSAHISTQYTTQRFAAGWPPVPWRWRHPLVMGHGMPWPKSTNGTGSLHCWWHPQSLRHLVFSWWAHQPKGAKGASSLLLSRGFIILGSCFSPMATLLRFAFALPYPVLLRAQASATHWTLIDFAHCYKFPSHTPRSTCWDVAAPRWDILRGEKPAEFHMAWVLIYTIYTYAWYSSCNPGYCDEDPNHALCEPFYYT